MIYSYEERKIGNAFGENLYKQTFKIDRNTDLTENNDYYFPDYVRNIVSYEGFVSDSDNMIALEPTDSSASKIPLNIRASSSFWIACSLGDYEYTTPSNASAGFNFGSAITAEEYPYIYITISYTKRETE